MSIKALLLASALTTSVVGGGYVMSEVNKDVNIYDKEYTNSLTYDNKEEISVPIYVIDNLEPEIEVALQALRTHGKDPNKRICIDINSYGGEVRLLYELINEIDDAEAEVVTKLNGFAFSAGGTLFLAGDKLKFGKESVIMLHVVRHKGADGKYEISDDPFAHMLNLNILKYYDGLITEDELSRFLNAEDVFIDGVDFKQRIEQVAPERLAGDNVCK